MALHEACIIGAGVAGLASVKVLKERGLPFTCYEMASDIGGLWRYDNDNGRSAAFESLTVNTSRDRMAYSDFPMPAHYPDYPSHRQVLAYLEAYAEHFGLYEHVTFQTEVTRVEPIGDSAFTVSVKGPDGKARTERYRAVLVASGHHWCPNWPELPGTFDGEQFHARDYRTPELFEGRRVLVVGVGNTGCDLVCEAVKVADETFLSTRRGAHILPRYVLGRPLDAWESPFTSRLPLWLRRAILQVLLWLTRGPQRLYGFPVPDYPLFSEHPTVSSKLLPLVKKGAITVKPDISQLEGSHVRFEDGSAEEVDLIVYATGYDVSFPFLSKDVIDTAGNEVKLYRRVVDPAHPGLYFIGFVQPLGADPPVAERQAEWVADLLEGTSGLPDEATMRQVIEESWAQMRTRYSRSKRHTLQVEFYPYLQTIQKERRKGQKRPKRQALPVQEASAAVEATAPRATSGGRRRPAGS